MLEGSGITIDPAHAQDLATVGSNPTARVKVTVGPVVPAGPDEPPVLVAISDWRLNVKFTDAGGDHNAEFPTAGPPRSLQELADKINEKLGIPNLVKFEVIDLPLATATAPRRSGTATAGVTADNVLEDDASDPFNAGTADELVSVGNLLINTADNTHCSITNVAAHVLTCALGSDMQWDEGDNYEVVGDNTKDLVVRLGVNFCAAGGTVTCDATTDQIVSPLSVPLNVKGAVADIVSVETTGDIDLYFSARAHLDVGIPIKLGIPTVQVLDTSGVSLKASVEATDIGLSAAVGPISVDLGTFADGGTGTGVGKLGAHLSLESDDDDVSNNKTQTLTEFVTNAAANFDFAGDEQTCDDDNPDDADPPPHTATGHACALLSVSAIGLTASDPIEIECDLDHAPADPLCAVTLPPELQTFLDGAELDWTLLLKVAQQILTKLEATLDGAAQNVKLPLVGNALDAGANVVGAFNDNVITPFNQLVDDLNNAVDQDEDGDVDPSDLEKLAHDFIYENLGPDDLDVLLDTNGLGGTQATEDDVVVTALCGTGNTPCADNDPLTAIKDFRVTFKLGQAIDGDVPFDIGLKGVPLKLKGGIHGSGSWSLLVDLGISFSGGPYIVANGKKGFDDEGPENRPFNADCSDDDDPDVNDCYTPVKYLQDDDTDFNAGSGVEDDLVEVGMWLEKTSGTGSGTGCRVTKVEEHKLYCDDFGTTDEEGISWDGTDDYKLVARHAPDVPAEGGLSELQLTGIVSMADAEDACDDATGLPAYLAGLRRRRGQRPLSRGPDRIPEGQRPRQRRGTRSDRRVRHHVHGRRRRADGAVPVRDARLQVGREQGHVLRPRVGQLRLHAEARRGGQYRRTAAHRLERRPERRLPERARQVPPVLGLQHHARDKHRIRRRDAARRQLRRTGARRRQVHHRVPRPHDQAGQGSHQPADAGGRDDPGRGPDHLGSLEARRSGAGDGPRPARGDQRQRPLADEVDPADDPVRQLAADGRSLRHPAGRGWAAWSLRGRHGPRHQQRADP